MHSQIHQPPIRGFMDIHTVATTTHIQARWVLWALEDSAWSSRQRNPVVSYWGKRVKIQGEEIPSIVGKPIKCLGKWINESLTDKESIEDTKKNLLAWLKTVDGSGLPGKLKAWIYQQGILLRLMWLLLIYRYTSMKLQTLLGKESKRVSILRR